MTIWIGVDIDDTLYSFNNLAREVFIDVALETGDKRLQRGAYCAWGEWRSPADVTDDDIWPVVIARCHSDAHIIKQKPFPRAAATLTQLVEQGYGLHYISNRATEATAATEQWLRHHDFPLTSHTLLTCSFADKIPELLDCQYLIDDRPKTLVQFVYDYAWQHRYSDLPRKGFGLYMPYNAALTDVPGIKLAPNWKLLRQYMIDQGVLQGGHDVRVALVHR